MIGVIDFFNFKKEGFNERDYICHPLIDAMVLNNYSISFIQAMFNVLKNYYDVNGSDIIVDVLFMKYLKKIKILW